MSGVGSYLVRGINRKNSLKHYQLIFKCNAFLLCQSLQLKVVLLFYEER